MLNSNILIQSHPKDTVNQECIIFVINVGGNHWAMLVRLLSNITPNMYPNHWISALFNQVVDMYEKCMEYYDYLPHDDPQHQYCKAAT